MRIIKKFLRQGGVLFVILCIALILNNRFGYITIIGIFILITFLKITLRTNIDYGSLIIFAYLIFYIIFSFFNGFTYPLSTLVLYAFAPFFFYQYGKKFPYKKDNEILVAWLIIIFCYGIDIYLTTISNIIETGELVVYNRKLSFTDDDTLIKAATLVGLPMSLGMVGLPMFFISKSNMLKLIFVSVFFLSMIVTFFLLNRTAIIVAILCVIIVIGWKYRKRVILLLSVLSLIMLVLYVFIKTNIISADILSLYDERNEDINTIGSRSDKWSVAVINLFKYPMGWSQGETYYVHNMWLDIARISGIIPFILLSYISIDCFIIAFKLTKIYDKPLSYMMLGLNVCFFATCFVEPIYGGTHFMLYCMLWGMERGLIKRKL